MIGLSGKVGEAFKLNRLKRGRPVLSCYIGITNPMILNVSHKTLNELKGVKSESTKISKH